MEGSLEVYVKFYMFTVEPNIGGMLPPKWMVKIMVPNPINIDDLGVPLFLETPILKYIAMFI